MGGDLTRSKQGPVIAIVERLPRDPGVHFLRKERGDVRYNSADRFNSRFARRDPSLASQSQLGLRSDRRCWISARDRADPGFIGPGANRLVMEN